MTKEQVLDILKKEYQLTDEKMQLLRFIRFVDTNTYWYDGNYYWGDYNNSTPDDMPLSLRDLVDVYTAS